MQPRLDLFWITTKKNKNKKRNKCSIHLAYTSKRRSGTKMKNGQLKNNFDFETNPIGNVIRIKIQTFIIHHKLGWYGICIKTLLKMKKKQ